MHEVVYKIKNKMDGLVDLYDNASGLIVVSETDKTRFRNSVYFSQYTEAGGTVWTPQNVSEMFEDFLDAGTCLLLFVDEHTPVTEAVVGFALVELNDHSCRYNSKCTVCSDASDKCLYVMFLAIHPNYQARHRGGVSRLEPFLERIRRFAKSRAYNCIRLTSINTRVAEIYARNAFELENPDPASHCLAMKSRLTFGRGQRRRRFGLHFHL